MHTQTTHKNMQQTARSIYTYIYITHNKTNQQHNNIKHNKTNKNQIYK